MNTSAVEGESNMHIAYVSVKTKSGKKDGKGEVIELNIKVPILQSAAEIKGGEELVLFRPRVERQKEGGTVGFDRF